MSAENNDKAVVKGSKKKEKEQTKTAAELEEEKLTQSALLQVQN